MVDINKDLENDLCLCGRYAWRVHCPHCGSYHTYSYTRRDSVTRDNNVIEHLTVYRCRRCAAVFNDDEWKIRCAAPHVELMSQRGRKPSEPTPAKFESVEEIPQQMLNALEILKKKRGL